MDQIFYGTLSKRDDDKRIVEGIATSESIDASGEINPNVCREKCP
jgi:hypothetical protein